MKSALCVGELLHARTTPRTYRFKYGVYYLYLDLDEIEDVDRRIWLFSYNRLNVLSLLDRDHLGATGCGLRAAVHAHLEARGVAFDGGSVSLLTNTRVLNYVFNPVSFYFVRSSSGELRHVIAEVHNTSGERHIYDLDRVGRADDGDDRYHAAADKVFYVSPFIDMDARYEFAFAEDGAGGIEINIDEYHGDERFFEAVLRVRPLPLTNANVCRMLLRYPLMTLKTIALIHWHGLKLWLRGVPYLRNPSRSARPR